MFKVLSVFWSSSWRADGRGELREDRLHEDGAHIRLRSVSIQPLYICAYLYVYDCWLLDQNWTVWIMVLPSVLFGADIRPDCRTTWCPCLPTTTGLCRSTSVPETLLLWWVHGRPLSHSVTRCSLGLDYRFCFVFFPNVGAECLVNWQRSVCLFLPLASPPGQRSDLWIWGLWSWGRHSFWRVASSCAWCC